MTAPVPSGSVPDHVHEGIEAIAGLNSRAERHVTVHQRGIERLTGALARPVFLYAMVACVSVWIVGNLALPLVGLSAFDPPPFHYLHIVLTLGALWMATVVLITQHRQIRMAEKHSHLDLQINLLSEGKIAKVIALLEELRIDLPNVHNRSDSEARAMALRTDPNVVLAALEESIRADLDADAACGEVVAPQRDPLAPGTARGP